MMLLTGNKRKDRGRKGFTFFEVMVTVAIFASGIVMIYKSLLAGLDYHTHLTNRLFALHYLEDQYSSIQREYRLTGQVPLGYHNKRVDVILDNRPVSFELGVQFEDPMEFKEGVHEFVLTLKWQERGRNRKLKREGFLSTI